MQPQWRKYLSVLEYKVFCQAFSKDLLVCVCVRMIFLAPQARQCLKLYLLKSLNLSLGTALVPSSTPTLLSVPSALAFDTPL